MKMLTAVMFAVLGVLLVPFFALSQQADRPKYNDGDWWRVKTELEVKVSSRNPACQDSYKEWLVKIDKNGLAHLYGVNDGKETESVCDSVLGRVFGVNESKFLKFPLSVGQTWTHRYQRAVGRRTIQIEPQYKVTGWEKITNTQGNLRSVQDHRGGAVGHSRRQPELQQMDGVLFADGQSDCFVRIGNRCKQKEGHACRLQCVELNSTGVRTMRRCSMFAKLREMLENIRLAVRNRQSVVMHIKVRDPIRCKKSQAPATI